MSETGAKYCGNDDVIDYLKTINYTDISGKDEIGDLIIRWSSDIDHKTKRKWNLNTVEERYSGTGQQSLVLHNFPIKSVSRLRIYNYNNQLIRDMNPPVENTDLIIDKDNGVITIPPSVTLVYPAPTSSMFYWPYSSYGAATLTGTIYDYNNRFGAGTQNICVNYAYGYDAPPPEIRDACIKLVVIDILKKRGASDSQGVQSESIAGMTETFGQGPFAHVIEELRKDVNDTLKRHMKRRLLAV